MLLKDFIANMESIAPRELAFEYDNPGLIVGTERSEIRRVLVALDCTVSVADEANEKDCDLVLTHHPLLFRAVKRIAPDDPATAAVFRLIRYGIGLFAAHTNLDCAEGGVNTELARRLGLVNETPVPPENLCRIGELPDPMGFLEFAKLTEKALHTRVRIAGPERLVKRIMVCGGSGGSEYRLAAENGADVLVTGECKHSEAIEAVTAGVNVVVGGHYETERIVLEPLAGMLRSMGCGAEFIMSEQETPLRTTDTF